jgi:hypothetical protein
VNQTKLLLFSFLWLAMGCGHVLYIDGPYQVKVIDRDSKQPIEGAAVVAVWWQQSPHVGHYMRDIYDAQDAITDQQGNFTIAGIVGGSVNPLAKIEEPIFTVFKPGYETYRARRIPSSTEDGQKILQLGSLALGTRQERIRNLDLLLPVECNSERKTRCVPQEKLLNLLELSNIERTRLGLKPGYFPKAGGK